MKSKSFGVVIHRHTGKVQRIFNPDYEWQLNGFHVKPYEFMLRLKKADYGISEDKDAMTLAHVHKLEYLFGA